MNMPFTQSYSNYHIVALFTLRILISLHTHFLVLRIKFASTSFSGSESSGGIIVSIVMSGGTAGRNIDVMVRLNGITAMSQLYNNLDV